MIEINLKEFKSKFKKEIDRIEELKQLDTLYRKYLGRKGEINKLFKNLKNFPEKKKKEFGEKLNLIKTEIEKEIQKKAEFIKKKIQQLKLEKEWLDVTRPGRKYEIGHLHPLTIVQREVLEIFQSMGFEVVEGPEVETEWYNFDALNIPRDHPARDMQDTLWIEQKRSLNPKFNFLMRTHTSPVQIRYMEKHNPPLRIVVPGRVFRNERTDATHDVQFYQLEGLMVDEDIQTSHFKAIIEEFLRRFFKKEIKIRLRPSFFPFTEPSFEIDVKEKGKNWMEMIGAGMVHPNVFKAAGLNPKSWQGFAFGVGLDRLAMLKYKIDDIRLFYSGDLRFLKQF